MWTGRVGMRRQQFSRHPLQRWGCLSDERCRRTVTGWWHPVQRHGRRGGEQATSSQHRQGLTQELSRRLPPLQHRLLGRVHHGILMPAGRSVGPVLAAAAAAAVCHVTGQCLVSDEILREVYDPIVTIFRTGAHRKKNSSLK